jgi:lipopolysaccharide export system protein LptC
VSWRAIITLALLAAAAISGWALWSQRQQRAPDGPPSGRPDYVLHDFELVALNGQGTESFTLRAPLLERDPTDETIEIATPLFLIPPRESAGEDAWRVRSATAWISAGGEELRLRGDVLASNQANVEIATDRLTILPEADRALTDARVTVTRPGSILSGLGFEIALDTTRYTLKSEVDARYVP